jgi:hypothetical protein
MNDSDRTVTRHRSSLVVLAAAALWACVSRYGAMGNGTPGSDSSEGDAMSDASDGVPADAPSDTFVAPANLHPFSDFEGGCGGWWPYQSTLTSDSVGHASAASCRVTSTVSNADISTADDHGAISAPVVGARYRVEAWVRGAVGANAPPSGVSVVIRTFDEGPLVRKENAESLRVTLDSSWQQITAELTITVAAEKLGVYVGATSQIDTAFLVDDVRVYRIM